MSADVLLSRLDGVRKGARPNSWLALCPAHDDKRPSLSIRETDDGRILLHCFAQCAAHDVLAAIGVDFDALFPERLPNTKGERRPYATADVLRALSFEALIVAVAATRVAQGVVLDEESRARLMLAHSRIQSAVTEGGL